MSSLNTAVKKVFEERSKFVILGLTGRTGAGCTTTGELLEKSFQDFSPPLVNSSENMNEEDRQYQVSLDYLKVKWPKFFLLRAADVISSFILEGSFTEFKNKFCMLNENISSAKFEQDYESMFNKLHEKAKSIKNTHIKSNNPNNENKSVSQNNDDQDDLASPDFEMLRKFSMQTSRILDGIEDGLYIKVYQLAANSIRKSGSAYKEGFDPDNIFSLARRMNFFIKSLRAKQKENGGNLFVCIDSLRNSFEVAFFRERYASFYLMALSVEEDERYRRLRAKHKYADSKIEEIDRKESPKSLKGEDFYISQNVPKCIEMADIHIKNKREDAGLFGLKKQLVRYLSLMMHPGLVQPTGIERCMQMALNAKLNSGCISRQVGAVVTDQNYSVKAIGWNDAPEGQPRCSVRNVANLISYHDKSAYSEYELTNEAFRKKIEQTYTESSLQIVQDAGWPQSYCFKDIQNCKDEEKNQVHTRALHAEENAFLQISKYGGQPILGGILFTTSSPCELCAKKAYQLGIRNVYYLDPYPGISGSHVFGVGDARPEMALFTGAVGRGYQQLFDPIMPYKEAFAHLSGIVVPNAKKDLGQENEKLRAENEKLKKEVDELKMRNKLGTEKS